MVWIRFTFDIQLFEITIYFSESRKKSGVSFNNTLTRILKKIMIFNFFYNNCEIFRKANRQKRWKTCSRRPNRVFPSNSGIKPDKNQINHQKSTSWTGFIVEISKTHTSLGCGKFLDAFLGPFTEQVTLWRSPKRIPSSVVGNFWMPFWIPLQNKLHCGLLFVSFWWFWMLLNGVNSDLLLFYCKLDRLS